MNSKLLFEMYPQLALYNTATKDKYIFQCPNGDLIEAPKHRLTKQDIKMLSIFLKPVQENFSTLNLWQYYLQGTVHKLPENCTNYQLLKIVFTQPFNEIKALDLILSGITNSPFYILETDQNTLFILFIDGEQFIDLTPFISVIEDDLHIKFTIFTTELEKIQTLRAKYEVLENVNYQLHLTGHSSIYTIDDLLLINMLQQLSQHEQMQYVSAILGDTLQETVLLETIDSYIETLYNFSQTAKSLFIHRNTLQKRLQRFEQLSKRSLKSADELFKIALAIKLYKMHTNVKIKV